MIWMEQQYRPYEAFVAVREVEELVVECRQVKISRRSLNQRRVCAGDWTVGTHGS